MLATINAAARELGCSPDHVRRMIKAGRWPYYRMGLRAIRLDPEEIKGLGRLIAQGEKGRSKKMNPGGKGEILSAWYGMKEKQSAERG
jgi:excisionase family DNA binding protein